MFMTPRDLADAALDEVEKDAVRRARVRAEDEALDQAEPPPPFEGQDDDSTPDELVDRVLGSSTTDDPHTTQETHDA